MDTRIVLDDTIPPPPEVSFTNMNSLIYREPAHKIINLKTGDKNLELQFIILQKVETIVTKKGERICKFLIADGSAAIHFNVFGESTKYWLMQLGKFSRKGTYAMSMGSTAACTMIGYSSILAKGC